MCNFWKGHWTPGYVSTPNISLFPKILSLKSFGNLFGSSYQVCYTRHHVSFYLWLIGSVLKRKVPKYYEQNCLEIFFLLFALPMMTQFSGKYAHLVIKSLLHLFHQKTTNKWRWKFSRVNFWPKLNIQNTAHTKAINLEI